MERKQLVITGIGAVTPLGIGPENFWAGLMSGKCGISTIDRFDCASLAADRAALVRDFHPKDFLPNRLAMDLEPFMQYAYISAEQAIRQAGLGDDSDRIGITMGTALSGFSIIGDTAATYAQKGRSAGPKLLTKAMGNICAAQLSIQHGFRGPSMTVSTACSSGGDAVMLAAMLLRAGFADAVVVMAGEACITPTMLQSLFKAGALSKTGESRPFDTGRNGFVMGEGGAALVLETAESANARGAKVLARLLGCANNADAYNPVSPEPDGHGAAECMRLALKDAELQPADVEYINAHGTATLMGDAAEAAAIRAVFGSNSGSPAVSSIKGAVGHMIGASGLAELVATVMALNEGRLPPNTGVQDPDQTCGLKLVLADQCDTAVQIALSNSMGFGGQNSCVILGRA